MSGNSIAVISSPAVRWLPRCLSSRAAPRRKPLLSTFALDPASGFKESNALYQRELPIWVEVGQALGLPPA